MMDGDARQLNHDQARRGISMSEAASVLEAVLGDCSGGPVRVLLPEWMGAIARTLHGALGTLGCQATIDLLEVPDPATQSVAACADRWVPSEANAGELLILCGVRPWSDSVEGDHLVEIEAMQRREGLLAAGQRLLFLDWPRGARRDAEVDLRPPEMARLYRRALDIDYGQMRRWNHDLAARLVGAREVRITCPEGTALALSVAGRTWLPEDCELGPSEPAVYLPGGEIYTAAVEDSAQGQVAFRHVGEPRMARFEGGLLVAVEHGDGRPDAALGAEMGIGQEPLCELGVGTNAWAPPWQVGTLYEKSAGTVHVAVGGNAHFGGLRDSPRHMDLIIRSPQVEVDGRALALPHGRWQNSAPLEADSTSSPGGAPPREDVDSHNSEMT